MSLGPVMLDLQGVSLTAGERRILQNPLVGGVILFSRNYESPEQLQALTHEIHRLRDPHLIVAVDHEGGRVQRFRDRFSPIPPMAVVGERWRRDSRRAGTEAETLGWLLAAELLSCGLDISFTPVLDLAHRHHGTPVSGVIGDRALHESPDTVARLGQALMRGMRRAGMAATGKHFPGHGAVREDSHLDKPVDRRPLADLMLEDIVPFERLIHNGLAGIMPAHVIYPDVDHRPAGYSERWLQDILRARLDFQGVIFSDDLSMEGADCGESFAERAVTALRAGCDMVVVCNHPEGAEEVIESLDGYDNPVSRARLARMHGRHRRPWDELHRSDEWRRANELAEALNEETTREMGV